MEKKSMFNGLALAIMIKIQNPNSAIFNFSLNKLTKIAHTNFDTAKESLLAAIRYKFIEVRAVKSKDGSTHQDLYVLPFTHEKQYCPILQIAGKEHPFAYLLSEYEKKNQKIIKTKRKQTLSDIKDIILEIFIAAKVESFYEARNRTEVRCGVDAQKIKKIVRAIKKADIREHNHINRLFVKDSPYKDGLIDEQNCGLSYQTIANWITGGFVSRFKVARLVQLMKKNGLIMTRKNAAIYIYNDEEHGTAMGNYMTGGWYTQNKRGDRFNVRTRTFMSSKGNRSVLKPLANLMIPTNKIFGWKKYWTLKKKGGNMAA